ncbi:MAG TPA: alpha/beta fold hydrolase [Candidatus Udaeobacter sp.]|nr:alpha/beta fold hydrolase [Candidatus Udaeobacter sp.]
MKRVVAACAILILITIISAMSVGWLLAHPVQTKIGNPPADLNAESVVFASASGATVHGWWCPNQNAKGAVLLLPGIRANRLSMVERARFLSRAGYSILLIDFQATGETTGDHITFGWKESRDVLAAVDFVRKTDSTTPVAIVGSSLGGAAALLATPPLRIDALILEEVYPTIEIATRNRLENYVGVFGRALTPVLLSQLQWRLGVSPSDLRPVDHMENVDCPIFIISGEKDTNTRPIDTRMLVERARNPKEVWFVPNAAHVDLHRAARREYETRVLAFLAKSAHIRQKQ